MPRRRRGFATTCTPLEDRAPKFQAAVRVPRALFSRKDIRETILVFRTVARSASGSHRQWKERAMNDIAEAKRRLPLPVMMNQLGDGEHAKRSALCPFHEDHRESFSVFQTERCLAFESASCIGMMLDSLAGAIFQYRSASSGNTSSRCVE